MNSQNEKLYFGRITHEEGEEFTGGDFSDRGHYVEFNEQAATTFDFPRYEVVRFARVPPKAYDFPGEVKVARIVVRDVGGPLDMMLRNAGVVRAPLLTAHQTLSAADSRDEVKA